MILPYLPLFFDGIWMTLCSWIFASTLSIIIGFSLGVLANKNISSSFVIKIIRLYAFVAKGVPAYVQILIAYFLLPSLLHIEIPGFLAANCALAFCSSGYVTEIVRAGINAIPQGQWEAAYLLGYSKIETLKRIILPQAIKIILSPLIGECEQLLKSTSLLATIGITELTRAGMNIISRELNPLPIYFTIALIYLIFAAVLNIVQIVLERRMHHGKH